MAIEVPILLADHSVTVPDVWGNFFNVVRVILDPDTLLPKQTQFHDSNIYPVHYNVVIPSEFFGKIDIPDVSDTNKQLTDISQNYPEKRSKAAMVSMRRATEGTVVQTKIVFAEKHLLEPPYPPGVTEAWQLYLELHEADGRSQTRNSLAATSLGSAVLQSTRWDGPSSTPVHTEARDAEITDMVGMAQQAGRLLLPEMFHHLLEVRPPAE